MNKKTGIRSLGIILVVCALVGVALIGVVPTSPSVRVIVQGESVEGAAAAVRAHAGQVMAEIGIINAVVAEVPGSYVARLAQAPGIVRVTPDRSVETAGGNVDVEFSKAVGASEVWNAGDLGDGVTIAFLDTGIDTTIPHLTGGNRLLAYYDAINGDLYEPPHLNQSPRDANGHGTHVAGVIGNNFYESQDGEYRGIAPEANMVAVRVLDETGVGSYSDVLQGLDWVVQNKDTYNIRVLNISMYATPVAPYWADPYNLAVMAAWEAGIVVVASAGNGGPDPLSIGVPGNTPYIITVGAFTDNYTPDDFGDDYIPPFSATGPTLDAFVKPDLIAPGAHVISLMKRNSYMSDQHPENRINGQYFQMAGTSMSAATVSGIVALMLSENPGLTPDQVKYRLTMTARPQFSEYTGEAAYSLWEQGAGRVWAPDAVFTDIQGEANWGMDLAADLAGDIHYEGWTYYDETTDEFRIRDSGYDSWAGGYDSWAGGYDSWAGGYDSWAGGYDSWAGGYDSWAGGYSSWAGGYDSWAGGYDSWAGGVGDPDWAEAFATLQNLPNGTSSVGINSWTEE